MFTFKPFHLWALAQAGFKGQAVVVHADGQADIEELVSRGWFYPVAGGVYNLTDAGEAVAADLLAMLPVLSGNSLYGVPVCASAAGHGPTLADGFRALFWPLFGDR
jgi:hypothetical protein